MENVQTPISPLESSKAPESSGLPGASTDGGGPGGIAIQTDLLEKLRIASGAATEQFLGEQKRRPGQRGPDKRPRKKPVPVASVGNGSPAPSLETGTPAPLESLWADPDPPYDDGLARQVIDLATRVVNDTGCGLVRIFGERQLGDKAFAREMSEGVKMGESLESSFKIGGFLCAKKYGVRFEKSPEWILGGAVVAWTTQISLVIKAINEKGAELRERAKRDHSRPAEDLPAAA
jgi:hypothetical protein